MDHVVAAQQKFVLELVVAQVGQTNACITIQIKRGASVSGNSEEVLADAEGAEYQAGVL